MNDLSRLEKHLRSWTPRPPSAALKARIFQLTPASANQARGENTSVHVPAWQWLAPAMAVFVVAMMSWTDGVRSSLIPGAEPAAVSALTDPALASYHSPAQVEHNVWPRATFDWTNDRRTLSTAAPVLVTNSTGDPP